MHGGRAAVRRSRAVVRSWNRERAVPQRNRPSSFLPVALLRQDVAEIPYSCGSRSGIYKLIPKGVRYLFLRLQESYKLCLFLFCETYYTLPFFDIQKVRRSKAQ